MYGARQNKTSGSTIQGEREEPSFLEVNDETLKQFQCNLCWGFDSDLKYYEYFYKVTNNYKHKLPLIFGKQELLVEELDLLFYLIFDFLFFKNSINNSFDNSYMSSYRGNKEFYDSFLDMSLITSNSLTNYLDAGNNVVEKFQEHTDIKNNNNIKPILSRLNDLKYLVTDLNILQEYSKEPNDKFQMNLISDDILIETLEQSLRNEITLLFYLNLNVKDYINYYAFEFFNLIRNGVSNTHSSKAHLLSILAKDDEIKNWLSHMLQNAINFSSNWNSVFLTELYNDIICPKKGTLKRILKEEKYLIEGKPKQEYGINKIIDFPE